MSRTIVLVINGKELTLSAAPRQIILAREVDLIQIQVHTEENDVPVEILYGDYRAGFLSDVRDGRKCWVTTAGYPLADCFGHAEVTVVFGEDVEVIDFDVMARKTTSDQARKMIAYLAEKRESLIESILSRTTRPAGSAPDESTSPEMMLSAAEVFVNRFKDRRHELLHHMRQRLTPIRLPLWQSRPNVQIDPVDVIGNLDSLLPSLGTGDLFLRGRHYTLSNIDVDQLENTFDVAENRILLGGLYSIWRRIGDLNEMLSAFEDHRQTFDDSEFESLSRLLLSVTARGMLRRCSEVLAIAADLIRLLERRCEIKYDGEIPPVMTAYVRSMPVYRALYIDLGNWYKLGSPSLEGFNFLMKLKSMSTIYELFVLFHLIDELQRQGWKSDAVVFKANMAGTVPEKVTFCLGDETLELTYEPTIIPHTKSTRHMELADMNHRSSDERRYYTPDFVLRVSRTNAVRYLILDAKYSRRGSVIKYSLPNLLHKYYNCIAAFDAINGFYTSEPIAGVFAIYALEHQNSQYANFWNGHAPIDTIVRMPMVGGIGLMVDNNAHFSRYLAAAMSLTRRAIN
jgi:hypothetical protein